MSARSTPASLHLCAQAACLLFQNGQTTERVIAAVHRLRAADAEPVRLTLAWGELIVAMPEQPTGVWLPALPMGMDIARVQAVEDVVDQVATGRLDHTLAADRLGAVASMVPVSLARFAIMAGAGAAALGVIFGAGDPLTVMLIAASAGLGGCLRRGLSHVSANPFLQPLAAALLAGLIAGLVSHFGASYRLIAVCPCMVLVPGPHFLNGTIDLVRARIPLGMARLTFASLVIVAICIGLLCGLWLGGATLEAAGPTPPVPLVRDVCAAGIAVAAYGSFFNMPWRMLALPIGVGIAAHALRWFLLAGGAAVPAGAFAACLLVSLAMSPAAHWLRVPWAALAFAAVVSLMPGVFLFQAASDATLLISAASPTPAELPLDLLRNAATASLILAAMTCGLILPKLLVDRVLGATRQKV